MGLSVQQLKEQLRAHGVDFSACREKAELQELLEEAQRKAPAAAPSSPSVASMSVADLKAHLSALSIDFSHCAEKAELRRLLEDALAHDSDASTASGASHSLSDGGFAVHEPDGRRCWVEFVDGDDALCLWEDGSDAILPASSLRASQELTGPRQFRGSFEDARAAAFRDGKLLVAAICAGAAQSKAERMMLLTLASEQVRSLVDENAIFWRGTALELREHHFQQLAPEGAPSLAMVLPLAVDAMRVLSHSQGIGHEVVVAEFVQALEEADEHRKAREARLLSDAALLRMEQDEEFAASLAADQQAALLASSSNESGSDGEAAAEAPAAAAPAASAGEAADESSHAEAEQLAKRRRRLLDEFEDDQTPPEGSAAARLSLRLPSGQRVQRTFAASDSLSKVRRWVQCCPWLPEAAGQELVVPESFELALAFPRRQLGSEEDERTLADLGLVPNAALLLVDTGA